MESKLIVSDQFILIQVSQQTTAEKTDQQPNVIHINSIRLNPLEVRGLKTRAKTVDVNILREKKQTYFIKTKNFKVTV